MKQTELIELLERRQLLAGITLFFPAWTGGVNGWIATAASGITADLGGPQNVPEYVMTIAPNSNGAVAIQSVTHVAGTATPQANNPGQILLVVNTNAIGTNPNYPTPPTAALITNFMENTPVDGVTWADLPMHLISTSIGTALTDSIAQSFDQSGIWVDQETYLDPDPDTSGPFLDALNTVYDNVEFADDYWRTVGSNSYLDPAGHPIDGAYNLDLTWVENDYSGYGLAHLAPPAYYDGTIDPAYIGGSDGDGPIHADWYGDGSTPSTFPSATQTGFLYTNIEGGTRPSSGLWAASGGTGDRTTVTHTGLQWPNVSDVASGSGTSVQSGTTLNINFIHQDQSQADNISFFLDSDQNPYDGTGIAIGTATALAASSSINSGTFAASLAGVAPGTYYIAAQATDSSGLERFDYSTQKITITAAPSTTAGTLTGTSATAASSYNLTQLGTSDWAAWGVSGNYSAFDHKATGGSQISNVTAVGSGGYGGYVDPTRNVSWTDGTPQASNGDDSGYLWANNAVGAGYSFTVPASTTPQTLYVYLGGFSSGSTLTAHLSDGSAPDYVASFSSAGHYNDIVAITYNAAYSGQTLTITDVKSQTINNAYGSTDLIAAWLGGGTTTVTGTAPSVWTGPTSQTVAAGSSVTFTASSVNGSPAPTVQWQVSTNGGASYAAIPGATSTTYSFTATASQNGHYYEAVFTNSAGSATTLFASLTVNTPPSAMLSGVQSTAASSYNLSTLGTTDWAHWGTGGQGSSFVHKATGGSQISNVTRIGAGSYGGYIDPTRNVSWTGGTPIASDGDDSGYLWANNANGAGYSFTVPASTTTHTLYVYLGGYSSGSTLTAHLSDGSAPDYVVNLSSSGHYNDMVAITYAAASAGQTLTLTYVKTQAINGASGSSDLIAAALA